MNQDAPTKPGMAPPMFDSRPGEPVSAMKGRYLLLGEIGRGGMGRVHRAYDPKLQREVAIKEVRGDALGHEGTQRLVAEARAMAMLSHPNVVAVHDVEQLADGAVALVMELVSGATLRQWCTDRRRKWTEIVERFVAAGRGLAAAHEAGLLHRDFKPSNVLIGRGDTVKVGDFGLAKPCDAMPSVDDEVGRSAAPSQSTLTAEGSVLGTPRYMAPEQHRAEVLTDAVDQFAFCVALWEALCGAPPYEGTVHALAAYKSEGPPSWPSNAAVPRPLVAAITRGLHPEPARRWPDMGALLRALEYDPRARRVQWLAAAGAVALVTAGGVAANGWLKSREMRCSGADEQLAQTWSPRRAERVSAAIDAVDVPYAPTAREHALAELNTYASDWTVAHTEACEATTIRSEQSSHTMDLRMACLQRARTDMGAVVQVLISADVEVVRRVQPLLSSLPAISRCSDIESLQAQVEPPPADTRAAVLAVEAELAQVRALKQAARFPEARTALDLAIAHSADLYYAPLDARVALNEALLLERMGKFEESAAAGRRALALATEAQLWELMQRAARSQMYVVGQRLGRIDQGLWYGDLASSLAHDDPAATAAVLSIRGILSVQQGDLPAAEQSLRDALASWDEVDEPLQASQTRSNLGNVLEMQGRHLEAEAQQRQVLALREEALGPWHPKVAEVRNNLALAYQAQARSTDALAEHRRALAIWEAALGPEHRDVATSRLNVGLALSELGRHAEAEAELSSALAILEATFGADHPELAHGLSVLTGVLVERGKLDEAEASVERALALRRAAFEPGHPAVLAARSTRVAVVLAQRKYPEAEAEAREISTGLQNKLGPDHPMVLRSRAKLARALRGQDRFAEAEAELRVVLKAREGGNDGSEPALAEARLMLAEVLIDRGAYGEALSLAERAWAHHQQPEVPAALRARSAFTLGLALSRAGESEATRVRAQQLVRDARADYRNAEGAHAQALARIDRTLAELSGSASPDDGGSEP